MRISHLAVLGSAAITLSFVTLPQGPTSFFEVEPNETKAEATDAVCMEQFDTIDTWGSCLFDVPQSDLGRDVFHVQVCPSFAGIQPYTLEGVAQGFNQIPAAILGLEQSAGVVQAGTDVPIQTGVSAINEYLTFYGFGKSERLYFDTGGEQDCRVNFENWTLKKGFTGWPSLLPMNAGTLTLETLGGNDTEIWVYDSEFNPLPGYGNDDPLGQVNADASLTREFSPGVYWIAVAGAGFANHLSAAEDDQRQDAPVMDFPGVAVPSNAPGFQTTLHVEDALGGVQDVPLFVATLRVRWVRLQLNGAVIQSVATVCSAEGSSGLACPCGNGSPEDTGRGCVNSSGYGALLLSTGSASYSLDDQLVHVEGLPPNEGALLLASPIPVMPTPVALKDGLLCLDGTLIRLGVQVANGRGQATWGPGLLQQVVLQGGEIARFQVAYRDPTGPCGTGVNYSSAIRVWTSL